MITLEKTFIGSNVATPGSGTRGHPPAQIKKVIKKVS
jgi:hypothetical protein